MVFHNPGVLSVAGYSSGDVIPVFSADGYSGGSSDTTSTTYTESGSQGKWEVKWNEIAPSDAQLAVSMSVQAQPGTDETYDVKFRNTDSSEDIIEITDVEFGTFATWEDYTPSNPGSTETVSFFHRTDPGTNSSSTLRAVFLLGVRLP